MYHNYFFLKAGAGNYHWWFSSRPSLRGYMKSSTKHKKTPQFKNATAKLFTPNGANYQGGISVSVWKERKGCNLDKILIWKNNSGSLFCISKDIHCLSDTKEFLYPHVLPKRIIHFNLNWHFLKFNKNDLTKFSRIPQKIL